LKTLGLFRHAKSDWHDPRARDFDRPLNPRGEKGAGLVGRHIFDHDVKWDKVIASPAVRVAETIELAAKATGRPIAVNWDRRIYLASSATLLDLLREQKDDPGSVLMVGHNPGLEDVIFDLVPDDGTSPLRDVVELKFPTASFAVLELDIEHWNELKDRCGKLVHLIRPRDLDPALGPEVV
jgi:phosphohistidine phosphatase